MQCQREKREQIPPDHTSVNTHVYDHMGLSLILVSEHVRPRERIFDKGRRRVAIVGGGFLDYKFLGCQHHQRLQRVQGGA